MPPPFGPTMKIFYRQLYMKRCVFAVLQQISAKKWANLRLLLNVQKQKVFQLQGAPPPDPHYRLALCALAMPPLCQILNTPMVSIASAAFVEYLLPYLFFVVCGTDIRKVRKTVALDKNHALGRVHIDTTTSTSPVFSL